MNIQVVPPIPAKLWFTSPGGTFRAKNTPFWGFFKLLSKMSLCMSLQWFFMVLNSNLQVPIPKNSSFTRFGVYRSPYWLKKPKVPKFVKMRLFSLQLFIYSFLVLKILSKQKFFESLTQNITILIEIFNEEDFDHIW